MKGNNKTTFLACCCAVLALSAVCLTAQDQPPRPAAASGPARAGRGGPVAEIVGDAKAGQEYFNGAGKCNTCHSPTGDLKGVGSKYSTTVLLAHIIYPRAKGAWGSTAQEAPQDPPISVTVTPASGAPVTGTLMSISEYVVTLKDSSGARRSFARNGDSPKVVTKDPLQAHIDMFQKWTDTDIHNLTAYLVTLK